MLVDRQTDRHTDRQTQTDTQTRSLQYLATAPAGEVKIDMNITETNRI